MFDIPSGEGPKEVKIHPTATVEKGAEFGAGVEIGPGSMIGPNVKLHDHVKVGAYTIIENDVTIGDQTIVYPYCSIGAVPQDLKYRGEASSVIIGKENSIREYANISLGTADGGLVTKIGNSNLVMVYAHVGHDSQVGDQCILANRVSLAGHVVVDSGAILGGHAAVHQFTHIGTMSITAGGAMVVQDLAPYCMAQGDRATVNGLNVIGLRRAGFDTDTIKDIKSMYKLVFKSGMTLEDAVNEIKSSIPDSKYKTTWLDFLSSTNRGLCR
jgi:UDP-N-acetylglucosamine acyltransferase